MKVEYTMGKSHSSRFPKIKLVSASIALFFIIALFFTMTAPEAINATAGATTSVHIVKYENDGITVLSEKTVDYEWMKENLPVQGDGVTQYYHQGPVFEGDMWDPGETVNLKDKGAVMGTDIKDLCDLAGGMAPGSEVVIHATDGYEMTLAYTNIYEPLDIQGPVALCWYKGQDVTLAETPDSGYPANNAYSSALQIIFIAATTNADGQHVFGNADMKIALPQEKYQHFYDGLPSTSGLSTKWVDELRIYPGGSPKSANKTSAPLTDTASASPHKIPWVPIALGGAGIILVSLSVYAFTAKRSSQ
jgi:hypothetical protein